MSSPKCNSIAPAVKVHPMLFAERLVRAILNETKCQTCRPGIHEKYNVGDLIYVRETWMPLWDSGAGFLTCLIPSGRENDPDAVKYRADGEKPDNFAARWRPSIHLPKRHSRIWLEITDRDYPKIQELEWHDFFREGVYREHDGHKYWFGTDLDCKSMDPDPQKIFRELWNQHYMGAHSWDANPVVTRIRFKRAPTH